MSQEVQLVNPTTGEVETEDQRMERLRIEREEKMTREEVRMASFPSSSTYTMYFTSFLAIVPHDPRPGNAVQLP